MSATELVHYEVSDGVGTITLDSPANRNALSKQLVTELFAGLVTAESDDSRVVLIRSSQRVFCSGADLSEAGAGGMEEGAKALVSLQRAIVTHPKPVVVRLDGPVRAGGLGIVAAADLVIAARDVSFAFTEVRLGLTPAVISLTVLPRLTSRAAADTYLTGRTFDAAHAAEIGLITRVADDVDAEVATVCADLAAGAPQGLRESKALLAKAMLEHIDANAEEMAELSARLFGSEEARQAMAAFLSRKK